MTLAKQLLFMGGNIDYTNLFAQGDCEATTGWTPYHITLVTDADNKYEGTNCLKVTISATYTNGIGFINVLPLLNTSKYYLISGYVKNNDATTGIKLRASCTGDKGNVDSAYNATTSYVRIGVILQPSDFDGATDMKLTLYVDGVAGQSAYFDAVMLNEISAADYAAGVDACLAKYPYKAP